MFAFVLSVTFVLAVWSLCSLAEASIYAVRMPYIRQLEHSNRSVGQILARFKSNMEQPISAILIVNTVVAAAGASLAGAQASSLFGEANLWLFSLLFTIAALVFSEIVPKVVGVTYSRPIACLVARPLQVAVYALYPLIWLVQRASVLIKPRIPVASAPEEEVQKMAEISAEEGSIMPYEADLVRHVLDLDKVTAGKIMTPVAEVTQLPDHLTVRQASEPAMESAFSRIPLYQAQGPHRWTGMVLARDLLSAMAHDQFELPIQSLAKPLHLVPESAPGHKLLRAFLSRRVHMFGVTSAAGRATGIVTLEDVLESLIGAEIVDEFDTEL